MHRILAPVSARSLDRAWTVEEDAAKGVIRIYFSGHVHVGTTVAAIGALADRLRERASPSRLVIDLFDVSSFDVNAPLAAVKLAAPVRELIQEVEIIAQNRLVVVASISAAHLLGLKCTVRDTRQDDGRR
jgi:hypothetical protein